MVFNISQANPEALISTPQTLEFENEALEDAVEFISQGQVFAVVRPYLKDPVGVQVVYSSTTTSGTPITGITIVDHMGQLILELKRGNKHDD